MCACLTLGVCHNAGLDYNMNLPGPILTDNVQVRTRTRMTIVLTRLHVDNSGNHYVVGLGSDLLSSHQFSETRLT
jgi:hypothetical protein